MRRVIAETLKFIDLYSTEAVELLLGTMAQESAFGKYRKQLGGGPALGIFQMEPATHDDCWDNYLKYHPKLSRDILFVSSMTEPDCEKLEDNDFYAICMCRVKYLRDSEPIPLSLTEQAEYWKRVYNTQKGKGTIEEYIKNYKKYVK